MPSPVVQEPEYITRAIHDLLMEPEEAVEVLQHDLELVEKIERYITPATFAHITSDAGYIGRISWHNSVYLRVKTKTFTKRGSFSLGLKKAENIGIQVLNYAKSVKQSLLNEINYHSSNE